MTRLFQDNGNAVPVTAVSAGPCVVTQVKTDEKDVPLPDDDDDFQFSLSGDNDDLTTPPACKKNTPKITVDRIPRVIPKKKKTIPTNTRVTRASRKRNASESDDEETPSKFVGKSKGRGGHFYSSWD